MTKRRFAMGLAFASILLASFPASAGRAQEPEQGQDEAKPENAPLKAGKPIFAGLVKSNTGKLISDKDTGLYDPSLEHTDYLVEGIVGTV